MPNLVAVLKEEISRLARKELKNELEALRKASSHYRSEIAGLKKRLAEQERHTKSLLKQSRRAKPAQQEEAPAESSRLRFRADGFKTMRARLGLSAEAMGKLLGVSGQSIYLWETGRTAPRARVLTAIAGLRGKGKREIHQMLEKMAESQDEQS
jgi:DNA-binding XRE family transcriptional regulator